LIIRCNDERFYYDERLRNRSVQRLVMPYKNNKIIYFFLLFSLPVFAAPSIIPDAKLKANKTAQQKSSAPLASTTFSEAHISKSPVINLSHFLQQEQSTVRLTNNSGDASQTALSLRGFGDNAAANSLILIDGFPLTNPSLLAPNFNSIPLSDIAHIEIQQGSQGSLWGDQAVGGVVNIITKHPRKFFTHAILSVGSYNTYYDNILIGNKGTQGWSYKVFALLGKTDNYRDHNKQNSNNAAMQIAKQYARGQVSFNLQSYGDMLYFPGGLSLEQFDQEPQQATEFHNYSRYRTTLFQILNQHALTGTWLLETHLSYQKTNGNGFVFLHFEREDSQLYFNPRLIGRWRKNKLIAGYVGQLSYYQMNNSKMDNRIYANQQHLYAQLTIPITSQLDFILGARKAWQINRIESGISESVHALNQVFVTEQSIIFHATPALSLFLRRDANFSFPKANEETWLPANTSSLQVQTGTSYETGIKWERKEQQAQLSIYRLPLHDEIAFNSMQTANQPFGAFTNLDDTLRYGISLSGRTRLTSKASVTAQINYVHARFASGNFSGNLIPAVPAITANAGIDYNWNENWGTQYNALYTGSMYSSQNVANVGRKVAAYWLNNIALQYSRKYFIISAEINNLFNTNYASAVFYSALTGQNIYYPAAGRNFSLTAKINL